MKLISKRSKGFTLIELMIVVAIIGILAAIAIPNFLSFQLKSKTAEGKTNLAAIRTAEESYYAELGSYVSANASPDAALGPAKRTYSDAVASMGFAELGWAPEGQVYFNYGVATATAAFTASAGGDLDGDATPQQWGYSTNGSLAAKDFGTGKGGLCDVTGLTTKVVGPCTSTHGQSVF